MSNQTALPELPTGSTFNEAGLETAMCLWEAMLEIRDRPDVAAKFEEVGTVAIRHAVMTLIPDCERGWHALGDQQDQYAPYDWEWCQVFLERNLWRLGINWGETCPTCAASIETRAAPCDECGAMDGEG